MALKNIKNHVQAVRQNGGVLATDQVQLIATATVPADANLANGRMYYNSGLGAIRVYIAGSWQSLGTSTGVATWDAMYDNDTSLTIDGTSLTFAGTHASNDVITITNATGTGDCLQITNTGTGKDINGTSSAWSVTKAGAAVFVGITPGGDITATAAALDFDLKDNQNDALTFDAGAGGLSLLSLDTRNNAEIVTVKSALVITGAQDLATLTATNDSAVGTAAAYSLNGSGAYTGVTTLSFFAVLPTGLEAGTAMYIGPAAITTGKALEIEADTLTEGILLSLKSSAAGLTTGSFININDGSARFAVKADGATTISSGVNSTVALTVTGIQTNENMVLFSSNGVTANGKATVKIVAAGATAAGSSVLLVTASGTPAASTSYLAHFDYTGATEETNDPITVQISSGASVGAALNITSTATTITGGVLNITAAAMTTGIGINLTGMSALATGVGINLSQDTSVIADTGSMLRIASSGVNTGGATNGTLLDVKGTGQLAGTQVRFDSIQTTGTVMSIISSGIMTTTGNLLTLTGNSATTAAGLLRVNGNGLTSGIGVVIASSSTALTTGYLFNVAHSGNATAGNPSALSCFSSAAADDTIIVQITASAALLTGGALLDLSAAALTTSTVLDMSNLDAITSGKAIHIDATGASQTSGILVHIDSASTALTGAGRLLLVDHTGNATAATSAKIVEFKSAATEDTEIFKVTASGALAAGMAVNISAAAMTTGTALNISDLAALTTGKVINVVTGTTRTDGIMVNIESGATAATSTGRMLLVNHTGATGVSTILAEVLSAATDETVMLQVKASGALALGKAVNIIADSCTTGFGIDMTMDALTTGVMINAHSDSADVTARPLVHIHNDNAAAVGTVPLTIVQDAPATAHFYAAIKVNNNTIWIGDGTTANAALAATTGDILFNGGSNKPEYCTNGAGQLWTALV